MQGRVPLGDMLLPYAPKGTVVNATVRLLGAILAYCETTRAFAPCPWSPSSADIIPISKCSREHAKLIPHPQISGHKPRRYGRKRGRRRHLHHRPNHRRMPLNQRLQLLQNRHPRQSALQRSRRQRTRHRQQRLRCPHRRWCPGRTPLLPPPSPKSKRINHNIRATTSTS